MDFKLGDVVVLKSGGPLMTVVSVSHEDVSTIWFPTEAEAARRDDFPAAALRKYEPEYDE